MSQETHGAASRASGRSPVGWTAQNPAAEIRPLSPRKEFLPTRSSSPRVNASPREFPTSVPINVGGDFTGLPPPKQAPLPLFVPETFGSLGSVSRPPHVTHVPSPTRELREDRTKGKKKRPRRKRRSTRSESSESETESELSEYRRRDVKRVIEIPKDPQEYWKSYNVAEDKKNYPRPDYDKMEARERAPWRVDFSVKLGTLRTAFPQFKVPEFAADEDLHVLHSYYERYLVQTKALGAAEGYRMYVAVAWMCMELFATRVLNISEFADFARSQSRLSSRYDRILLELGEKAASSTSGPWPVEAQLLWCFLLNVVVFLVTRYVCKWVGASSFEAIQDAVYGAIDRVSTATSGANTGSGGGFDIPSLITGLASMFPKSQPPTVASAMPGKRGPPHME